MEYDLIVVGGGHAGCEAALAAAGLGLQTLLITISPDTIGAMSCNPAIGGPAAKSHLVRELDALGGIMGRIIDRSYLNIRTLNETRGPAVAALRAQADKRRYQSELTLAIERQEHLFLKSGLVVELLVEAGRAAGVRLKSGRVYRSRAVLLATGTFLGGEVVMGQVRYAGGRQGEPAALELSDNLRQLGLKLRRFQTATPPRISRRSLDFSRMVPQPLQPVEWGFSWNGLSKELPQQPCWQTVTTPATIEVIRNNMSFSPIQNGIINCNGPHFCPSIDRKVMRFPDKTDHLIFVEPEGVYTEEMYLLGLTTAMPEEIQEQILTTIPGLEHAEIIRPGYAVEYDCLESFQFYPTLESKQISYLFTAGQLNGTSGYEEAAVQGVVAGINVARKLLGQEPLIINRSSSYIGVLIDDLVTKGTEEPYRMMTSLAEFRIFYRLDNAMQRLGSVANSAGLLNPAVLSARENLELQAQQLRKFYGETKVKTDHPIWKRLSDKVPVRGYRLHEVILRPECTSQLLEEFYPEVLDYPLPVRQLVWNELKLEGYLQRQRSQLDEAAELDQIRLEATLDYEKIPGLSASARKALQRVIPLSLGQALRIPELSESDRAVMLLYFKVLKGEVEHHGISS